MIQKFLFNIFCLPFVGFLWVVGAVSVGAQQEPDPFFLPGTTDTENSKLKPLCLRAQWRYEILSQGGACR